MSDRKKYPQFDSLDEANAFIRELEEKADQRRKRMEELNELIESFRNAFKIHSDENKKIHKINNDALSAVKAQVEHIGTSLASITALLNEMTAENLLAKIRAIIPVPPVVTGSINIPSCEICLRQFCHFFYPKLFSCGHTVCVDCAEKIANGDKNEITCPFDRTITCLHGEGVKAMRPNFAITNLLNQK